MSELVIVITHIGEREKAKKIGRRMVKAHLAASAQMFASEKIRRVRGQSQESEEWRLTLVTTKERYSALEAAIRSQLAEEDSMPAIVAVPCVAALPLYADWVSNKVSEGEMHTSYGPKQSF